MDALDTYGDVIDGWAHKVAEKFVTDVNRHNEKIWYQQSEAISLELRNMVKNAPVGQVLRSMVEEQVNYIKSLPIEAADRIYDIHNKAIEAMVTGQRPGELAKEIAATGDVAMSRATLIARTEIGRATTALTQARALAIGSPGYIWRTADDGDVRESHLRMKDQFVPWDKPPTLDGMTGHAGALPNCRCYCEVVIPHSNVVRLQTGDRIGRIITVDGKPVRVMTIKIKRAA